MFPRHEEISPRKKRRDWFWEFSPTLRLQNKLKVSVLGDSLVKGSFTLPYDTRSYFVNVASDIIARDLVGVNARTVKSGAEIFNPASPARSANCTRIGGLFTHTLNGVDASSLWNWNNFLVGNPGDFLWFYHEIETMGMSTEYANIYEAGTSDTGTFLYRFASTDAHIPYTGFVGVRSWDFVKSKVPTATRWQVRHTLYKNTGVAAVMHNQANSIYKLSKGIAIENQGVDGESAGGGLARIAEVTAWTPDVCVVCYGTNDIRAGGDVNVNRTAYLGNLTAIVNALKAANIFPVLGSIPILASTQTNYLKVTEWNTYVRSLACSLGVGFWDRYRVIPSVSYLSDGRHPTVQGYQLLGQDLADRLRYGG